VASVDPGVKGCGVAIFIASYTSEYELLYSKYVEGEDANQTALLTASYITKTLGLQNTMNSLELVLEMPQIYAHKRRKQNDDNDLLQLAYVNGLISGAMCLKPVLIQPRCWKGTVAKDVMTRRIETWLSPTEWQRVGEKRKTKRHNVIDAIGLGIYYLRQNSHRK